MTDTMDYNLGATLARDARLGLIVLQADETIEHELRRLIPEDGVGLYTTRVASADSVTPDTLKTMRATLPAAAKLLPRHEDYAAVGYGCTSGASIIGADRVRDLITAHCPARAVTDPLSALIAACRTLDIRRLALLSPYVAGVSDALRNALTGAGISTPAFASFNEAREDKVARIEPASVRAAAVALYGNCAEKPDAVFLSCTNLQTFDVIAEIESACDCPVLSSNLVLGWHMLRLAGLTPRDGTITARLLETR